MVKAISTGVFRIWLWEARASPRRARRGGCYRNTLLTSLGFQHSQPRGFLNQRQHLHVQQPVVDFHPVVCPVAPSNFDPSTRREPRSLYVLVQGNSFSRLFWLCHWSFLLLTLEEEMNNLSRCSFSGPSRGQISPHLPLSSRQTCPWSQQPLHIFELLWPSLCCYQLYNILFETERHDCR